MLLFNIKKYVKSTKTKYANAALETARTRACNLGL